MTEHVIVTDDGPVRLVRMNRPAKKNALTDAMYDAMAAALETAAVSNDIRCVVLAGGPGPLHVALISLFYGQERGAGATVRRVRAGEPTGQRAVRPPA